MNGVFEAALADPWGMLDTLIDGPLHPGGTDATNRLLDRADVTQGTRLLDVGCGAGDALTLASDRGAAALGVDHAPEPDTANSVQGDATALPVKSGCMDVVLAECVLCLTELEASLTEAHRVLTPGGRLAISDMVVENEVPTVSEQIAEAFCLTGARNKEQLTAQLDAAGFDVLSLHDHHEDLVAMGEQIADHIDYDGLLSTMGERGQQISTELDTLASAIESEQISYVSVIATATEQSQCV